MLSRFLNNKSDSNVLQRESSRGDVIDVVENGGGWVPPSSKPTGAVVVDIAGDQHALGREARRDEPAPGGDAVEIITTVDALPLFTRKMYDDDLVQMPPSMRQNICPVEVVPPNSEGGKKHGEYAIILTKEMLNDDYVDELVAHLAVKWDLVAEGYYVASDQVLIDLARDKVMENRRRKTLSVSLEQKNASTLYRQFELMAEFAMANEVSDLHIDMNRRLAKSQVSFRIHGKLVHPPEFLIDTHTLLDMVAYLYNNKSQNGSQNSYNENLPQQCQLQLRVRDRDLLFRWASGRTALGSVVVLRMLYQDDMQSIKTLEQLGYFEQQVWMWRNAISRHKGGISVAGIVGSGKSTTMQTNMANLPDTMAKYTVEDPVEYLIPGVRQFNVSRSLTDTQEDSFIAWKRQLKRMDPSAVLIGECRDLDSASMFRDIVESGHLGFTTVHAPSHVGSIDRFCSSELGIPREVMATPGFMNLLVYQALVPINCECCQDFPARQHAEASYLNRIERLFDLDVDGIYLTNKSGCPKCSKPGLAELNGIAGRKVVAEMLELDTYMLDMIRNHKNMDLIQYVNQLRVAKFSEEDSSGKSAMEVAMYRCSRGQVSPYEIEEKFGTFEQYENEQRRFGLGKFATGGERFGTAEKPH
ncbi:Flp pilus assembly complex ATPase component TadA [Burkholderia cepacia]